MTALVGCPGVRTEETEIELRVLVVVVVEEISPTLPALLEAVALPVHLQDMDMVSEAVEEGAGEPFRAEDLGPLRRAGWS